MIIPNKHNGYTRDGVRRVYIDSGGGGGGTQQSTSYTTNVPEYAKEPFMEMIGKGVALSEAPYQAYGGERTAQFTPLQRQAFGQAEQQGVAPQLGQASGIAGLAAQQGLQAGQFQPGTFAPMGVQAPQLQQFQMGPAQRVSSQSFAQPGAAEQFMSPYMQQVVGIQQREAQRAADIAGTQRGAQAVRAGAFGGTRQAIMDAEAQRNLAQQMGDIQATGSQAAFQQAQQQFNQEQQARLQAQMANQQAGLTVGQQNLGALLGIQQLGAGQNLQSQMANQQALMDAQRAFEQSRQFGADIGLRGGAQALQGAQTLGQLGQQQFGQEMDIMGARQQMGGAQQQQIQNILNQQYADFQAQRDFPYQQLGFLSDLLRGTGSSTRTVFQSPQASPLQQVAGLGTAAFGASQLMRAKGGLIPEGRGYADGGITSLLGDQELAQTAQNPSYGPMMQMAAQDQMAENAALRAAAPQGMPTPMAEESMDPVEAALVIEMQKAMNEGDRQRAEALAETIALRREERMAQEEMGLAGMMPEQMAEGIPEGGIMGMAMGGAVQTYQTGGDIVLPRGTPRWMAEQERLANPGSNVRIEGEGEFYSDVGQALSDAGSAVKRGFLYSSDVEAQRAREQAAQTPQTTPTGIEQVMPGQAATDAMRNQSRAAQRTAAQTRVAEQRAVEEAAKKQPEVPADGGIAALTRGTGFDTQAAMSNEFGTQQGIAAGLVQGVDDEIAAQAEAAKARGLFGEERERRLKEEEAGLVGKKDEARSMALIQAGLSILSADPSRGALSAIGQGALQGLGAYKGDIKDLEKNRERILDKMDEIADIRRQETMADGKERRALVAKRNQAVVEGQKLMYNTLSRFTDIEREEAKMVFEAGVRERVANITASGRNGTGEDKKITAAENAFQRDPEAASIRKQLESPLVSLDPVAQQAAISRLRQIQEAKYKQFGVTMAEPTGGADMTGFRLLGVKQ